ncbi:uncharacterized protein LODBEIA_P05410 [Lodderomyces beijingensis]|uniref:Transcription initiation factor IIE subunit beta n=1 Tax=Lodderomyces beijingensis TaxID=1775926 RepID=A0ABP0ZJG4_9ASCO
MSDLSAQLSAFKNKIKSGPSVAVARKPTVAKPSSPLASQVSPGRSKYDTSRSEAKRPTPTDSMTELFKKQKTTFGDGSGFSGSHLSTQLHLAVEYIKEQDRPVSIHQLQSSLSFDIGNTLFPLLREIDRVKYDDSKKTFEYVSLHNIKSTDDLLEFLRKQTTSKGISVKEIKDGWAGCLQAIDELEADHKILVLRNKKENAPRLVWANAGSELGSVSDEFKEMWVAVKLPEPDELYQKLIDQGLKPTGADPSLLAKKPQQQEKKQKKARRGKITNTHMKGILKDYSQLV